MASQGSDDDAGDRKPEQDKSGSPTRADSISVIAAVVIAVGTIVLVVLTAVLVAVALNLTLDRVLPPTGIVGGFLSIGGGLALLVIRGKVQALQHQFAGFLGVAFVLLGILGFTLGTVAIVVSMQHVVVRPPPSTPNPTAITTPSGSPGDIPLSIIRLNEMDLKDQFRQDAISGLSANPPTLVDIGSSRVCGAPRGKALDLETPATSAFRVTNVGQVASKASRLTTADATSVMKEIGAGGCGLKVTAGGLGDDAWLVEDDEHGRTWLFARKQAVIIEVVIVGSPGHNHSRAITDLAGRCIQRAAQMHS